MTERILFVDDDLRALESLRRMLHKARMPWDVAFARNGLEAISHMERHRVDVLITDLHMPGMDGVTLLGETMRRFPHTVRFVLSDQVSVDRVYRTIGPAHQYLAKPAVMPALQESIERALTLRGRLHSENMRALVGRIGVLPSLPSLYYELSNEVGKVDASLAEAGRIIERDLGMSAKVLQLANSAFFGLRQQVVNASQAVALLGLDIIRSLIVWFHVASQLCEHHVGNALVESLQQHSMRVAAWSRIIAHREHLDRADLDTYYTAGLFHDVGKLILVSKSTTAYTQVLARARGGDSLVHLEHTTFGASHGEIGAYLLALWGFADLIVEACCFHHNPAWHIGSGFSPLTAVYFANWLEDEACAKERRVEPPTIDLAYLQKVGMHDRLSTWREACLPEKRAGA